MNLWQPVTDLVLKLRHSIAFWPVIVTSGFVALAWVVLSLEGKAVDRWVQEEVSYLAIRDNDTARLIIGTVIGGMISMMVFSFTMVMTTLSRASASLSPRVIPGIISKRSHQITLGVNLGTILFALILATRIAQDGPDDLPPSAGVLLAILLALVNLVFFVAFIESISRDIQVDRVCVSIYHQTRNQLIKEIEKQDPQRQHPQPGCKTWPLRHAERSGYLIGIDRQALVNHCARMNLSVCILSSHGDFVQAGMPLLSSDRELSDGEWEKLSACLIVDPSNSREQHFSVGLRKLREIAVKALSPGINDPGSAVLCADLLSALLPQLSELQAPFATTDARGISRLWIREPDFGERVESLFLPIHHYGRDDAFFVNQLSQALDRAASGCQQPEQVLKVLNKVLESSPE